MKETDILLKLAKIYHCSIGQILCSIEGWDEKEPKDKKKVLEDAIARMDAVHGMMIKIRKELLTASIINSLNVGNG